MQKKHIRYYLAISLAAVTVMVYLSSFRNEFLTWDDVKFNVNNYHIRSLNWDFIRWAFTDVSMDYWRPLTWISQALDYAMWGLDPWGYHLTAITLHVANTLIALVVVLTLLTMKNVSDMRSGLMPALSERAILITGGVTGLLFGLHPVHVEPAVWISNRVDLLYPPFFLLSILAYALYVRKLDERQWSANLSSLLQSRHYVLSIALFVLALLSKPSAVTLPAVLLLLDWYPFRRILSFNTLLRAGLEKIPFFALSIIASLAVYWAEIVVGSSGTEGLPVAMRALVALKALVMYVWHVIVPVNLSPFYPYPVNVSLLSAEYFIPAVAVCGITAACILTIQRQRILIAVWLYFLATLSPVLGFIKVREVYMADRYEYLPSLGLFLLAGLAAAWTWERMDGMKQGGRAGKLAVAVSALLLCLGMASLTLKQISVWNNSIGLWNYVIEKAPQGVPAAHVNRGMAYKEKGRLDRALEDYTAAIALDPGYVSAYIGRGNVYRELERYELSWEDYTKAISLAPSPVAYTNRGVVSGEMAQIDDALSDLNIAIALDPSYPDAYVGRGVVFELMNELLRAKEDYDKAVLLNPYHALAYENRGIVLGKMGMIDKAIEDLTRALSLKSADSRIYSERGQLLLKEGNNALAERDFEMARELRAKAGGHALRAIHDKR